MKTGDEIRAKRGRKRVNERAEPISMIPSQEVVVMVLASDFSRTS